jgi:enoyl-CoA hydratase
MLVEVETGPVAHIRLNRPEKLNAANGEMLRDIREALLALDADEQCRAIVVSGAGRSFCAGRDLKDVGQFHGRTVDEVVRGMREVGDVFGVFEQLRTLTLCAVQGHALGLGCAIALLCDLTVADETAQFALTEAKRGIAAFGPLPGLLRAVPYKVALDMALTGMSIDAKRAYDLGLVSRLTAPGDALSTATDVAQSVAAIDTAYLIDTKSAVALVSSLPPSQAQEQLTRLAALHHLRGGASSGLDAFLVRKQS